MLKKYIRLNIDKSVDSPSAEEFFQLTRLATKKEKYVALTLLLLAVVSISLAIILISQAFIVSVPSFGGTFTEGIVGVPRFNNPLLASSDADRDLVALVYSGLLRSAQNGAYIPDLAENYSISNDGLQYTFNLRKNILWHDGVSISARDILFTVQLVQNNLIKSPKRANWEGLKVEVVDEHTVQFILKQPYAPFLENATLGILPEHIWSSISTDEFALSINNINAIGTGPYAIKSTKNDSSGVPSEINLTANPNFALGRPFIKNIKLHFYSDEEKLLEDRVNGVIEGASGISSEIASKELSGGNKVISSPLYRIFAVFFNTSQSSVLADKEVRKALELATPRKEIVSLALHGFGNMETSPFGRDQDILEKPLEDRLAEANTILDNAGWRSSSSTTPREKKGNSLEFILTTSDSPELKTTAAVLSDVWSRLGVKVVVKIYEPNDLNTNVIRPRKFDALLFGEVLGHYPDPYAFWHSKQRLDPGLNISSYTNPEVDKSLTIIRENNNPDIQIIEYKKLERELSSDIPAIFLYSPHYIYLPPKNVHGIIPGKVNIASDRFLNINSWFIEMDKVWTIFAKPQF